MDETNDAAMAAICRKLLDVCEANGFDGVTDAVAMANRWKAAQAASGPMREMATLDALHTDAEWRIAARDVLAALDGQ